MTIAALVEPTVLVSVYALSIPVGSSVLSQIVEARLDDPASVASPVSLLALLALAVAVVAETGRLPVDNPSTHLELTMVHEAMVLESSGRDLAWLELGSWLRLGALLGLLSTLLVPVGNRDRASPRRPPARVLAPRGQARDRWEPFSPRSRSSWRSCGCSASPSCWPGRSCWPSSRSPRPTSWCRPSAMSDSLTPSSSACPPASCCCPRSSSCGVARSPAEVRLLARPGRRAGGAGHRARGARDERRAARGRRDRADPQGVVAAEGALPGGGSGTEPRCARRRR